MPVTPMFPLGSVLVPGMVLPLHVFEERYRRLVRDCLHGDGEFGVVLIARGSEVGGGDVRTDAGTIARILQTEELPDGRFAVGAVGVRRIRVERWLPDDPYPRAEVADWPDVDGAGAGAGSNVGGIEHHPGGPSVSAPGLAPSAIDEIAGLLRRVAARRSELREPAPPLGLELSDDPVVAGYQATVAAPLGPVDRQALLCAPSVAERFDLLRDLLYDELVVLEARLSGR